MPRLRVRLFGRAIIEVNDRAVELTPTTTVVFIRLLIAGGAQRTIYRIGSNGFPDARLNIQRGMYEVGCHEGNIGLRGILAGARAQEKQ